MNEIARNRELVQALHQEKLTKWRSKPLARPDSYLSRMLFAVNRIPFSIENSTATDIESHIRFLNLKPSTRFEVVRAINELLKWLGRPKGIPNPRPEHEEQVVHIELFEFMKKLEKLPEEYQIYMGSLYATGARYGELPMLNVVGDWAFIGQQLRDTGTTWRTKNGKQRHAAILPPLKAFILAYKRLPFKTQASLRLDHYYKLYGACRRVYGVRLHALRHSYAIECARRGCTVEQIADWVGDTIPVTQKHYIGYLTPTKGPWG